jgi:hypothetical protein
MQILIIGFLNDVHLFPSSGEMVGRYLHSWVHCKEVASGTVPGILRFGLSPSFSIAREHNVSETGSVSVLR